MLIAVTGMVGGVSSASAQASDLGVGPSPVVTTPQNSKEVEGRCRFEGAFDTGKGTGFMVECRAEFEVDLRDNKPLLSRPDRDDDFLKLVCNGERVYNDDVKAKLRTDHGARDRDLILIGKRGTPRIVIDDVRIRSDRRNDDNNDRRATLEYSANGFTYMLQGRCDLDRENDHGGPSDLL
jgi:hypothetical protein